MLFFSANIELIRELVISNMEKQIWEGYTKNFSSYHAHKYMLTMKPTTSYLIAIAHLFCSRSVKIVKQVINLEESLT